MEGRPPEHTHTKKIALKSLLSHDRQTGFYFTLSIKGEFLLTGPRPVFRRCHGSNNCKQWKVGQVLEKGASDFRFTHARPDGQHELLRNKECSSNKPKLPACQWNLHDEGSLFCLFFCYFFETARLTRLLHVPYSKLARLVCENPTPEPDRFLWPCKVKCWKLWLKSIHACSSKLKTCTCMHA